ncbi:thermonuclease family protein [Ekhidna sp.]
MKRISFLCMSFLVIYSWASLKAQDVLQGKIVYVSDGDTYHIILSNSEKERIRLADVDCPEKSQAFGLEAKEFVANMINGKTVSITKYYVDHYERIIASVNIDGKDVATELVSSGLAWHYKRYSDNEDLSNLEKEARQKGLGLWADPDPLAPWEYRKKK